MNERFVIVKCYDTYWGLSYSHRLRKFYDDRLNHTVLCMFDSCEKCAKAVECVSAANCFGALVSELEHFYSTQIRKVSGTGS